VFFEQGIYFSLFLSPKLCWLENDTKQGVFEPLLRGQEFFPNALVANKFQIIQISPMKVKTQTTPRPAYDKIGTQREGKSKSNADRPFEI